MRTTLTLDDDILATAKSIASRRGVAIGEVVSELARRGLNPPAHVTTRSGFPLFPVHPDAGVVTPEIVAELLTDD